LFKYLGENEYYARLTPDDKTEIIQQAFDVLSDRYWHEQNQGKKYVVLDLLKTKPLEHKRSSVDSLFNFLCFELEILIKEHLRSELELIKHIQDFALINNLIVIQFTKGIKKYVL
jgi:hypothetical protein